MPAAPLWSWVAVALAVIFAGVAAYTYRSVRGREETIRRQLARESALKARFDDVFDRSSDVMIVHDRRGRVSTINRAGEHAIGYSREDVRGLDPNGIFSHDYLDTINRMLAEGAESLPQAFRSELSPRRGNRVPVDVHARVLVGDGQVVGVMSIARDLSERDRLENELREAQKMVAVGQLATGIAHDFNNLITVLIGYSDELIEDAPEGSPVHHAAVAVRRAAERAAGLTKQLLSFSRRPQQHEASPAVPSPVAHHSVLVRGEGVILLAEDDPSVRRLVVTELTRRGFTVIEAEDGRAALEVFQREKDRVDVLVTDVVMPRLNGADLAKEAERIRPGTKILFISGHPERAGSGLNPTGVTNLLLKPFTADTLAARIKGIMTEGTEADGWRA